MSLPGQTVSSAANSALWPYLLAMVLVVVSANVLVQYPVNDWLTWGAITYPLAFLLTDLCNRRFGPEQALFS